MELLIPDEMAQADQLSMAGGLEGYVLMQQAGEAVYKHIIRLWPDVEKVSVLCGIGNNGGDGYVVARLLQQAGKDVRCFAVGLPISPDAVSAHSDYLANQGLVLTLSAFIADEFELLVDAIFGAGLSRAVTGEIATCIDAVNKSGIAVCSIDLPSGVSGLSGQVLGAAVKADQTVTFFRKKPGHLLLPGRALCGDISLCDIGIEAVVLDCIRPVLFENLPDLWRAMLPVTEAETHKFRRGHVAVFSGGLMSTGAARLSAAAAARSGAGLVTVIAPADAMAVHAAHLTSTMLYFLGHDDDVLHFIESRKVRAAVLGPAFGDLARARHLACALLDVKNSISELNVLVLDADGITAFKDQPQLLFSASEHSNCALVLTPHEGEFHRLFGGLVNNGADKLSRARQAARTSHSIVIYKGADTVIAAPDGRAAINSNGNALLATAGSGDVLAGIVAGLCAQGMPVFEAACAAVWVHAETANCFEEFAPAGMIAEDMPDLILDVWAKMREIS